MPLSVLVFCRAERYFCRTKGRNRGESISAIVSAISAGEKGQNLLKPDNNKNIDVKWTIHVQCTILPTTNSQFIILFVCSVQHKIKSVLQDLPNSPCLNRLNLTIMRNKLTLIQDSFHMFRSFTLLDLEPEHTLQKQCPGGTCYTNLHFKVTSICQCNK